MPFCFSSVGVLSWNANGLANRVNQLRELVERSPVDLILVQEVIVTSSRRFMIANYNLFFTPRPIYNHRVAGDSAIYVHRRLVHSHILSLDLSVIENTIVKILLFFTSISLQNLLSAFP